jgi:hypothetical protein
MGLEQGAIYTLTNTDSGVAAVFNDPTSANFVGFLTEVPAGLDSTDVRENAVDRAQGDGGFNYNFYATRRALVLTGLFSGPPGATLKAQIERLQRVANMLLRVDGELTWQETGDAANGITRKVRRLRRQGRLQIGSGIPKSFTLPMVSSESIILTDELGGVNGTTNNGVGTTQTNLGTVEIPPRFVLLLSGTGSTANNPIFKNSTTGKQFKLLGTFSTDLIVDLLERTVTQSGVGDIYGKVDFLNSAWWGLAPGANKIEVTDSNGIARTFTLYRRHGWA